MITNNVITLDLFETIYEDNEHLCKNRRNIGKNQYTLFKRSTISNTAGHILVFSRVLAKS